MVDMRAFVEDRISVLCKEYYETESTATKTRIVDVIKTNLKFLNTADKVDDVLNRYKKLHN